MKGSDGFPVGLSEIMRREALLVSAFRPLAVSIKAGKIVPSTLLRRLDSNS